MNIKRSLATTLIAMHVCLAGAASTPQTPRITEAELAGACSALLRAPLAAPELQVLLDVSRQADYTPALRCRAMAAYSLTLLMQGNTNGFERARLALQAAFPDECGSLLTVTRDDALSPCDACKGKGVLTSVCPICRGLGKCKTCDATGQKDGSACGVCKGKGTCTLCSGAKLIDAPCASCRGTRQILKAKTTVRTNYDKLLAEIVSLADENARFTDQFRIAASERNLETRINLLRALLRDFSRRTDLGPAQTLLAEATNKRRAQEQLRAAREKKELEERDLIKMRQVAAEQDLDRALALLSSYLQENPNASTHLELKILLDELVAKRDRRTQLKRIVIGICSTVGLVFLFVLLRHLLVRKTHAAIGPLPGINKLDKTSFTDPLSLNAIESKSRVKTKTSSITPPQE